METLLLCITTINQLLHLKKLIKTFIKTKSNNYNWHLIIADDGSTDGTIEYIEKLYILNVKKTIIKNNNSYIYGLINSIFDTTKDIKYNIGFMCSNNIYFKKEGWDKEYVNKIKKTGYDHLVYSKLDNSLTDNINIISKGQPLVWTQSDGQPLVWTFTPKVIQNVGYFDEFNFKYKNHSQIDFTMRCCRVGFNNMAELNNIENSNNYIELQEYLNKNENLEEVNFVNSEKELKRRYQILLDNRIFIPKYIFKKCNINDYFDKIFVINMEKSANKMKRINKLFGKLGIDFERFNGTNPDKIKLYKEWKEKNNYFTNEEINFTNFDWKSYVNKYNDLKFTSKKSAWNHWDKYGKKENRTPYKSINITSKGAWGCLHSHLRLINYAKEMNYKKILIFEDDVIFHKNYSNMITKLLDNIQQWKLLYFGATQLNWKNINILDTSYTAQNSYGTFAYAIDSSIFNDILILAKDMLVPIDNYLTEIQSKYKTECHVSYPNIVISDLLGSDVNCTRDICTWTYKLRWELYNYV